MCHRFILFSRQVVRRKLNVLSGEGAILTSSGPIYPVCLTNGLAAPLNLARLLVDREDWSRVRHHLNEVLRLNPNHAEAMRTLAKIATAEK